VNAAVASIVNILYCLIGTVVPAMLFYFFCIYWLQDYNSNKFRDQMDGVLTSFVVESVDLIPPFRLNNNIVLTHTEYASNDPIIIIQIAPHSLHILAKQRLQKIIQFPTTICDAKIYAHNNAHHCAIICLLENGDLVRISLRDKKKKRKKHKHEDAPSNGSSKRKLSDDSTPTKRKKTTHSSSQLSLFDEDNMALDEERLQSTLVENFTTAEAFEYTEENEVSTIDVKAKLDRYLLVNIPQVTKQARISLVSQIIPSENAEDALAVLVSMGDGSLELITGVDGKASKKKKKKSAGCVRAVVQTGIKLTEPTCLCGK
jgi:hypothetical protein